jgi:hypothetical protein
VARLCSDLGTLGLFSAEAAQKLKQVFATILAPAERGDDHVSLPIIERTIYINRKCYS